MRGLYFVVATCVACGSNSNSASDAAIGHDAAHDAAADTAPDAAHDAPADAAAVGTVTASVLQNGVAQMGIHVLFTNADSSLVADVTTDANGSASQTMAAGGYVTAIGPFPLASTTDMYTVADVQPGDQLVFSQSINDSSVNGLDVSTALVPGAASYIATSTFAGGSLTPLATKAEGGVTTTVPTTDFIIIASDGSGNVLGTLYEPPVTPPTGSEEALDLTGESYVAPQAATYRVTNVPWKAIGLAFDVYSLEGQLTGTSGLITLAGGSGSTTIQHVSSAGLIGGVVVSASTNMGTMTVLDWGNDGSDYSLDLSALQLPGFETAPVYDLIRNNITWTPHGGTLTPDLVRAELTFTHDDNFHWWIVAPYAAGSLSLPNLAGHMPAADDFYSVQFETAQVTGGYAAAHADLVSKPLLNSAFVRSTPGRVVTARF